jgi:hypothetical protein
MTGRDDVAQSLGPTEPKWDQPAPPPWLAAQVLASFQTLLCQHVKEGRCTGYPMPKVGAAKKLGRSATLAGWPAGLTSGPPSPLSAKELT